MSYYGNTRMIKKIILMFSNRHIFFDILGLNSSFSNTVLSSKFLDRIYPNFRIREQDHNIDLGVCVSVAALAEIQIVLQSLGRRK
jgi:hypothetical protein